MTLFEWVSYWLQAYVGWWVLLAIFLGLIALLTKYAILDAPALPPERDNERRR